MTVATTPTTTQAENPISDLEPDLPWPAIESQVREALECYGEPLDLAISERELQPGDHFRLALEELPFPDGVGSGAVVAYGAYVLGEGRVGIELEHDRRFRHGSGDVGRPLYLNDYLFIRTFQPGNEPRPGVYHRAMKEVESARQGLERARERAAASEAVFTSSRLRATVAGGDEEGGAS